MRTDWLLVRRLASELEGRLRGGRITAAGLLPDGRFACDVGRERLIVDAFAATPLAWLADAEARALDLRATPGWSRSLADGLVGKRVERVRSRRGDRLLALDAGSRSRFGVEHAVRLVCELTPRFGNVVLLKDQTVVAAAKLFEPDATGRARAARTIVVGDAYEPPPLPSPASGEEHERESFESFVRAARASADGAGDREVKDAVRALRRDRQSLPETIATSLVVELLRLPWPSGDRLRAALLARADALLGATEGEPSGPLGDLFVYRTEDELVAAHVVPLAQFARPPYAESRERALLPLVAELAEATRGERARLSFTKRRDDLARRLDRRIAALHELETRARADRDARDEEERLRRSGDALYTHHAEIPSGSAAFVTPDGERVELDPALDARANAAAFFRRYRKLRGRRDHAERRLVELDRETRALDELAWEIARADPETLPELAAAAADELGHATGGPRERTRTTSARGASPARARPPKPTRYDLGDGARVLVGRSPAGNTELTFRTARPDDWWFHAKDVPGAHVVLQLDDARDPTAREVEIAAAAAAAHSARSRDARVAVDRTRRKHVRRRPEPGRVFYVEFETAFVAPALPTPPVTTASPA